jgi:protein-L-isoaspartate(D-aspartate) O-methyltransferase
MSLPLPFGQETGRPLSIVGAVAALDLEPHHAVLEVGTGSGWQTALIAGLSKAVASIERWRVLADAADRRLQRLNFDNVVVAHGDGRDGLSAGAPFDRIIINASIAVIPDALAKQVRDAGVIVAPIIRDGVVMLTRMRRSRGRFQTEELGPATAQALASGVADGR